MTLEGKRLLITGVLTRRSIAFAVAREAQLAGAEVVLTGFGRGRRMTERAADRLPAPAEVLELDVNSEGDLAALADGLASRWGRIDGALHAIAFAPEDAIGGHFLETPPGSAVQAFQTSAYSYAALARHLAPLMNEGGSLVGLDFDASITWPSYDWMGVAKAALESVNRYLARELGPRGIRANLISAGPISSPAAGGIAGFEQLADGWDEAAPLGWDTSDPSPVAGAVCLLFSDAARAISGELIHVDGGAHAIGGHGSRTPGQAAAGAREPGDLEIAWD
jgi:meromycolic acid enoyl-[acyl-carrier-protein] reductase